ncbi:GspE/PulE family protein, partial [Aquifex sp.]
MSELSSLDYIIEYEDEKELLVVVPEGYDPFRIEELRFLKGKNVNLKVVSSEEYAKLIQEKLSLESVQVEEEESKEESEDILFQRDDSPAVRLVNTVLIKASSVSASDVHFEPYEDETIVRLRMDGVLHDYTKIPNSLYQEVVSRIKVMAKLNVAEKRVPQDGKIRVRIGSKDYDIRVSTVPTLHGERVVLRLLEKTGSLLTLDELGLSKEDVEKVKRLAQRPYGIVLVTGPTGAGKSTTLYAMLLHVKNPKKNIITIEDPVEYQVKGISQIQVNPKVGLTFAAGLRSILR